MERLPGFGRARKKLAGARAPRHCSPTALVAAVDPSYYASPAQLWNPNALADYQQAQAIGLHDAGGYFQNFWGMNEKWTLGADGWYAVLPNGELRRWAGSTAATLQPAALVGTLDRSCYDDPSQLCNQPESSSQLTIRANGFVGTFVVEVTVSDGYGAQTQKLSVTVS